VRRLSQQWQGCDEKDEKTQARGNTPNNPKYELDERGDASGSSGGVCASDGGRHR